MWPYVECLVQLFVENYFYEIICRIGKKCIFADIGKMGHFAVRGYHKLKDE